MDLRSMNAINMFTLKIPNQEVIVCRYVDDILIMSKDIAYIEATKCMLASMFYMKDLRVADVILGINILKAPKALELY